MSSPASTTTTAMETQTYWCHVCDLSVSLPSATATATATALVCPHCDSDFLEELDSDDMPNPNPNPNPNRSDQNSSQLLIPSSTTFPFPPLTAPDDNFLLNSPYLHRLIQHLHNSDDSSPSTTATATATTTTSRHHSATSKSAIEAIPLVKITSAFLAIDPIVLCAVCKDQFVIDDETKQLPCKHLYHPDCILPWLVQHNSCPVCRFQLPTEPVNGDLKVRRRSRSRVLRLGNLMDDDDDDEGALGFEFSNLTRRHRLFLPRNHYPEVLFPPVRIGQTVAVDVLPDSGLTDRLDTASSWPNWNVDGGAVDGGDMGVNADWVDDLDAAMP